MKLYSENKDYKLYQGNMLDMLEVIESNTIDNIITDPPYELNFMGKGWDNSGIAFQPSTWTRCYEVLKPGGYLLAFGGSRTFHRIACAIEDAGFEIRDTIMYLYGSGFPKSMNIGKQLEKKNDKENALKWKNWGTALKPSYESIIVAQKPYSIEIYLLIEILDILNEVMEKCQLNLNANIVEKNSQLNQAKQIVEENIVLKNAESKMFTKEDLLEVMDMLQLILMENTNWSTELLCLNFLVEICNQMSKYTTETKINLITELKILKLLVVQDILKNTIEENKTKQLGMKQNALTVEEFLKEEKLKLNYMNILSVQENAILQEKESNLHPSLNQIIIARKPFKGSLVDNVIEYGVGGINIDECRVPIDKDKEIDNRIGTDAKNTSKNGFWQKNWSSGDIQMYKDNGRFPANTILTYDETDFDEVCGGFPNTKSKGSNANYEKTNQDNPTHLYTNIKSGIHFEDSGSASRYFYCAKASKKDRDEGLDEFEATTDKAKGNGLDRVCEYCGVSQLTPELCHCETKSWITKPKKNTHPTVKPTELMQYLIRLVSPNGATILDPFNGSGSTGKAVMYENRERNKNYKYIGIELTKEYLPIAKARIEYVCNLEPEKDIQMSIFDFIGDEKSEQ